SRQGIVGCGASDPRSSPATPALRLRPAVSARTSPLRDVPAAGLEPGTLLQARPCACGRGVRGQKGNRKYRFGGCEWRLQGDVRMRTRLLASRQSFTAE